MRTILIAAQNYDKARRLADLLGHSTYAGHQSWHYLSEPERMAGLHPNWSTLVVDASAPFLPNYTDIIEYAMARGMDIVKIEERPV